METSIENTAVFLKKTEVFSKLSLDEINLLLSEMKKVKVAEGETLFREGDPGGIMYILLSGNMVISINSEEGGEIEIGSFQKGNFFGEMSLFQEVSRSATCYALQESTLLSFPCSLFYKIISDNPNTAIKLMRKMLDITVSRLESSGEYLADLVRWGEEARKRAVTDSLTGLFNRRFLDDALEQEVRKAVERHTSLSVLMMDVDRCRMINERYGEENGDRIMMEVTRICRDNLRDTDIISRYGGDEFTIILPDTGKETAEALAESIRRGIASLEFSFTGYDHVKVTISIGISVMPQDGKNVLSLKETADKALYRAKKAGRNRTAFA
jgi:diguanylate cyclase (GGDEF)-like protein